MEEEFYEISFGEIFDDIHLIFGQEFYSLQENYWIMRIIGNIFNAIRLF